MTNTINKKQKYYFIIGMDRSSWNPVDKIEYHDCVLNQVKLILPTGATLIVPAERLIIRE